MRLMRLRKILWERILEAAPKTGLDVPMVDDAFHIMGTIHLATLLAEKRGLDREVAGAAMILHDIGRLATGKVEGHARDGAHLARPILAEADFTPAEADEICQAIATHIYKQETGSPLEELVRDADVLEVYLAGMPMPPTFTDRVNYMKRELGLA